MIGVAWLAAKSAFGFIWRNRQMVLISAVTATVFGLWQLSAKRADIIDGLKGRITLLNSVVSEYENAQKQLDERVSYERTVSGVAADSAAAVAAGRINGDGPMAPVLRGEYDRVRNLAADRKDPR